MSSTKLLSVQFFPHKNNTARNVHKTFDEMSDKYKNANSLDVDTVKRSTDLVTFEDLIVPNDHPDVARTSLDSSSNSWKTDLETFEDIYLDEFFVEPEIIEDLYLDNFFMENEARSASEMHSIVEVIVAENEQVNGEVVHVAGILSIPATMMMSVPLFADFLTYYHPYKDRQVIVMNNSQELLRNSVCYLNTTCNDHHIGHRFPFDPGANLFIVTSAGTEIVNCVQDLSFIANSEISTVELHLSSLTSVKEFATDIISSGHFFYMVLMHLMERLRPIMGLTSLSKHDKFGFEFGNLLCPMEYAQMTFLLYGLAERFDWKKVIEVVHSAKNDPWEITLKVFDALSDMKVFSKITFGSYISNWYDTGQVPFPMTLTGLESNDSYVAVVQIDRPVDLRLRELKVYRFTSGFEFAGFTRRIILKEAYILAIANANAMRRVNGFADTRTTMVMAVSCLKVPFIGNVQELDMEFACTMFDEMSGKYKCLQFPFDPGLYMLTTSSSNYFHVASSKSLEMQSAVKLFETKSLQLSIHKESSSFSHGYLACLVQNESANFHIYVVAAFTGIRDLPTSGHKLWVLDSARLVSTQFPHQVFGSHSALERIGIVTIVGVVVPPGETLLENLTFATLGILQSFWGRGKKWAQAMRYNVEVFTNELFNVHITPYFSAACVVLAKYLGVVFFMANIRCGGELGILSDLSIKCKLPSANQQLIFIVMFVEPGKAWKHCPKETFCIVSEFSEDEVDLVVHDDIEIWSPMGRTSYCFTIASDVFSSVDVNTSRSVASVSSKYRYFSNGFELINGILLVKPDSCITFTLNCVYGLGVLQSVLITVDTTGPMLLAINRAPPPTATDGAAALLELMNETWSISGIIRFTHNLCFGGVFFQRHSVTNQVDIGVSSPVLCQNALVSSAKYRAEEVQSRLRNKYPSFMNPMLSSNVGGGMMISLTDWGQNRVAQPSGGINTLPFSRNGAPLTFGLLMDPYFVDRVHDPHLSVTTIAGMISALLCSNLEDKVLIEGGSIVVNITKMEGPLGKTSNYIWDPGGNAYI